MAELEFGGYLPLEERLPHPQKNQPHSVALALNSGRNALLHLLQQHNFRRLWIPSFICQDIIELLDQHQISRCFYPINASFEPIASAIQFSDGDCVLLVNYFGVCCRTLQQCIDNYPSTITDNTQAYFSPVTGSHGSFYSPRKFFGVPDGGFALHDPTQPNKPILETDNSDNRLHHLKKRREVSAAAGYADFRQNEHLLSTLPLRRMSEYTRDALNHTDFSKVAQLRLSHFSKIDTSLAQKNALNLEPTSAPLAYPFSTQKAPIIRHQLIEKGIFIPFYWPDVKSCHPQDYTQEHADNILALPLDQNMTATDVETMLGVIDELL